ncbi:hypothetical protein D8X55_05120 [Malacoplasma penetrans]|uniref:Uncharacterized protein n=1 Tax=Malacoplasma penetrans (strain HF-2) TaxID=272633 RepID=Q8EW54_MALP2|nr:hypothetical protein [Malacoplasma penetrans]RXY95908.1 hypothetical protein D8X55_05120 [Malacoplasma penetrans]BAC44142.1 hypothetical protein [Malacoplasma penetrans HF-2]
MKKIHKIAISTILALSVILFIVVAAWQPCAYAFIVPAILTVVGLSYLGAVFFVSKSENKKKNMIAAVNA